MLHQIIRLKFSTLLFIILWGCSCNKPGPYVVDYKNIKGYVIGREICNTDTTKDNWLIDFTYGAANPIVGDTVFLNGITYTNVLKTNGLDPQLKVLGIRVSIDYRIISVEKIVTANCSVTTPVTFNLKALEILNQGEIR